MRTSIWMVRNQVPLAIVDKYPKRYIYTYNYSAHIRVCGWTRYYIWLNVIYIYSLWWWEILIVNIYGPWANVLTINQDISWRYRGVTIYVSHKEKNYIWELNNSISYWIHINFIVLYLRDRMRYINDIYVSLYRFGEKQPIVEVYTKVGDKIKCYVHEGNIPISVLKVLFNWKNESII